MERIAAPEYRATEMDVLRSRVPTTGINEIEFPFKEYILRYARDVSFGIVRHS